MEKISLKSNDLCVSTTGTPNSHLCMEPQENNFKYTNSNFAASSDSSSQNKEVIMEYQKLQHYGQDQSTKKNKILPTLLPLSGANKSKNEEQQISLQEKSLLEMGYKTNEVKGWENIVQPPKEDLFKLLKKMIDNNIKPSVHIRIGEITFNCHMMVLQCYSDFFMECNNEILIQLPEEKVTPAAFSMVYDWMLAPQPLVQREGILEIFNAANFLRIKELVNQCWLCLDDVCFSEDTAFLLYLEARNYGLEILEQLMLMRICKFFLTLVASQEFLTMNVKEICTLLSSNTIGVNSETEIFMSAVRWLSHNWPEREHQLLDVMKCVRFSLMPPWFLVTLNKNGDGAEIGRIIEHPEIKKMITDGITYTNIQIYYGENRQEFLNLLERFQLLAPTQRQWIYDKECKYHHRLACPNIENVNYISFLEYLEMIRSIGKDYWRSLEMDRRTEKSLHSFYCTDCRKTTEPNLASVCTKDSCDQGIQCSSSLKNRKSKVSNFIHNSVSSKNSVRRSPRGFPKCVPLSAAKINKSIYNENATETETTTDLKYTTQVDIQLNVHEAKKQHKQQQQQQQHLQTDVIEQRNFIDSQSLKQTFSNHIDNDEKISQQQQKQQLNQQQSLSKPLCKRLQQNKLDEHKLTDNCCTTEIYTCAAAAVGLKNVNDDAGVCLGGQQKQPSQQCLIGHNPDVELMVTGSPAKVCNNSEKDLQELKAKQKTSAFIHDLTRISNHKVLVFGGIDPYCLHSQHVQRHQQHQQQHQTSQKELKKQQQLHLNSQREYLQRRRVHSIDSIIMKTTTHSHPLRSHQMQTHACTHNESYSTDAAANKNLENFGDHVLLYTIDATEWRHISHIPFGPRHHHAVVVCNGLIYVIGGTRISLDCTKKSIFEKSIWCLNPKTMKWHLETNLPESRRDFAAIAVDDETDFNNDVIKHELGFYVIGGESVNGKALSTVWFYNIKRKLWLKKPSLNMGRYGLAAAMVNNEIWVAGGIINDTQSHGETLNASTAHVITDTIEIYNLNFTYCDDVFTNNHTKGFANSKFVKEGEEVEGGEASKNYESGLELKNKTGNGVQWAKSKQHLRIPRLFGKFCKMPNGQLYLVGGLCFNSQNKQLTSLTDIDVFNEQQQKWEHVGNLNKARHGHDVATLSDHCFVVIGGVSTFEQCTFNKVETFCIKTRKSVNNLTDLPWPVSGCAAVTIK